MSVPYSMPARWPAASATVLIWAVAIASLVFWGLRLSSPRDLGAPPSAGSADVATSDPEAVARMLGAVKSAPPVVAAPDVASRFTLLGVVADDERQGAALISVDGQTARPFRVGSTVADGFVLQSLSTRGISLGTTADSPPLFAIELPARPMILNGPTPAAPAPSIARPSTTPAPVYPSTGGNGPKPWQREAMRPPPNWNNPNPPGTQ